MTEINAENRTLFEGDNLPVLQGLDDGTIDLIATDPPFNKGRDFHATPDSLAGKDAKFSDRWKWSDLHDTWMDDLQNAERGAEVWEAVKFASRCYGEDMGAFLAFMAARLLEMRRVLKPTGSIYLHCDDTAGAYLRGLMDAIFDPKNLRGAITWKRAQSAAKGNQHAPRRWSRNTDTILHYARSGEAKLIKTRPATEGELADTFPKVDNDGRRYRSNAPLYRGLSMGERPNLCFEWRGYRNRDASGWRLSRARMDEEYAKGNIVIREDGELERRSYADDYEGVPLGNLWDDLPALAAQDSERTGYPTQKPLALYDRIIRASSNEGDWVLDPFAGCATTPIAAELAGRKWIAIDLWPDAHRVTQQRLDEAATTGVLGKGKRGEHQPAMRGAKVIHRTDVPARTDGGETAAAYLATPTAEPSRPLMSKAEIKRRLLDRFGLQCWGCAFTAPDERYLELDHLKPRSEGGPNEIFNRALLCGPCNRDKSDGLTMAGLRKRNGVKKHPVSLPAASAWAAREFEAALLERSA